MTDRVLDDGHDELVALERGSAFDDPTGLAHGRTRPAADRDGDTDADRAAAARAEQEGEERRRAIAVLRRGLAVSPELRQGLRLTVLFAVLVAVGRLTIPVLDPADHRQGRARPTRASAPPSRSPRAAVPLVIVIGVDRLSRVTYVRLVRAAEAHAAATCGCAPSPTSTG